MDSSCSLPPVRLLSLRREGRCYYTLVSTIQGFLRFRLVPSDVCNGVAAITVYARTPDIHRPKVVEVPQAADVAALFISKSRVRVLEARQCFPSGRARCTSLCIASNVAEYVPGQG
jgi:hypothetical protein